MAHQLDFSRGQGAAMFSAGNVVPWHGLGKMVADAQSAAEAIRLAQQDWLVEQFPVFARLPDGSSLATDRVANVRSDTHAVLGVVGKGYHPLQYHEAYAFMDDVVGAGLAKYETAGCLQGGKRVWLLCRLPRELKAGPSDTILPYGLLCNGHDGSLAVHVQPTSVRVVCQNTLSLALSSSTAQKLRIKHTESLRGRVDEARAAFGLVNQAMDGFQTEIDALAGGPDTRVQNYFETLFPVKRKPCEEPPAGVGREFVLELLEGQRQRDQGRGVEFVEEVLAQQAAEARGLGRELVEEYLDATSKNNAKVIETLWSNYQNDTNTLPGVSGTAWAAYNAVSEYADHQRGTRGKTDKDRADNRLNSVWFGSANDLKQKAYSGALDLAR
jgi:phage/plasmid-like protein (TIGR03299 family)